MMGAADKGKARASTTTRCAACRTVTADDENGAVT